MNFVEAKTMDKGMYVEMENQALKHARSSKIFIQKGGKNWMGKENVTHNELPVLAIWIGF